MTIYLKNVFFQIAEKRKKKKKKEEHQESKPSINS